MMPLIFTIGVLIMLGLTNTGSYLYGGRVQKAIDTADAKVAQDKAIADANEQSERDKRLAVAEAVKDAKARTASAQLRNKANAAISATPLPTDCAWDDSVFSLLLSSVISANGEEATADGLRTAVQRANAPRK